MKWMAQLVVMVLGALVACGPQATGPGKSGWVLERRVVVAEGAELMPDDPAQPGFARPERLVFHDGRVFVVFTHIGSDWKPAGPSWISVHDAETLERTSLVPLIDPDDGTECRNAGGVKTRGDSLFATCAGAFDGAGAVAEMRLSDAEVLRVIAIPASPGSIEITDDLLMVGDLMEGEVLVLDRATGEVLSRRDVCSTSSAAFELIGGIAQAGGRLFATCFSGGFAMEISAVDGSVLGSPLLLGDGPKELLAADDRLLVLDNLGGTLSLVHLESPLRVEREMLALGGSQAAIDPQAMATGEDVLAITNSGFGTLLMVDLQELRIVDSVDLKTSASAGSNFPVGVAFGDGAFFVALSGSDEIARVVRRESE